MRFRDIQGLSEIKKNLIDTVKHNRISHSQMFLGIEGSAHFALALAYAQYINCERPLDDDSCGECHSCQKYDALMHPDLHFVYPVAKISSLDKKEVSCFNPFFINNFRSLIRESEAHFSWEDWIKKINIENKQASITVIDAKEIVHSLSYKNIEGKYKVMIIWRTELMHTQAAPKLLKIIEEPPPYTLFIFVNSRTDLILDTILSRTQLVKIRPYTQVELSNKLLSTEEKIDDEKVDYAVKQSSGSLIKAKKVLQSVEDDEKRFVQFREWMRMCFKANMLNILDFSTRMAKMNREEIKQFLNYALDMVRKCMIINYSGEEIIPISNMEANFIKGFSPYINDKNLIEIIELINESIYQIERNAKEEILFTDLSIKISRLLFIGKKKNIK